MNLPTDILAYVQSRFPLEEQAAALAVLLAARIHTGAFPEARLLRCAAVASAGDLLRLQYYVGLLAIDWRDVIVAGEYVVRDRQLIKAYDLCQPITDDLLAADGPPALPPDAA